MTLNHAFGQAPTDWAGRFSADAPLLTFDLANLGPAFETAVELRRRATGFVACLLVEDARTKCAIELAAPTVLGGLSDYDQRRRGFEAIALELLRSSEGVEQSKWIAVDVPRMLHAFELLQCADVVAFRSVTEANRVQTGFRRFSNVVYCAPPDARVPPPNSLAARRAMEVVVWAPDRSAAQCAMFAFALEELRLPVTIVCASASGSSLKARYVSPSEGAAALAGAAAIVDASLYDPGTAIALRAWERPIATASTSGAHEWLQGVCVYDPWNASSIYEATVQALGALAPQALRADDAAAEIREGLARTALVPVDGPLITCVVPTYNRRESLATALASIARQTYTNFEVIVVNDAGQPVGDIVARFANMRELVLETNSGMAAAVNAGAREGRGRYLALLADDDEYFPDHFGALAGALERTGATVAHGGELGVHYERRPDGSLHFTGYSTVNSRVASNSKLLVQNMLGGPSVIMQREAFLRIGGFDPAVGHLADFNAWMKLSQSYDFVRVDRITSLINFRTDTHQISAKSGADTAALYRKIFAANPAPGRPMIEELRAKHLAEIESRAMVHTPPTIGHAP